MRENESIQIIYQGKIPVVDYLFLHISVKLYEVSSSPGAFDKLSVALYIIGKTPVQCLHFYGSHDEVIKKTQCDIKFYQTVSPDLPL